MILKTLLALAFVLSLAASAASAAAEPGLTFYSNGSQEWMPFEQFVSLDLPGLKGKLQDIANHTDWVRSISEQEFKNVVSETIADGKAVSDALKAKRRSHMTCAGKEPSEAAECSAEISRENADLNARVSAVDAFVRDFEQKK